MTYVWDPELRKVVPLAERRQREARTQLMLDSPYDGMRTVDGVDISTRRRYREYSRLNGLTHPSDFKEHWQKRAAERAKETLGLHDVAQRTRDVAEAFRKVEAGYKPRRVDYEGDGAEVVRRYIPEVNLK